MREHNNSTTSGFLSTPRDITKTPIDFSVTALTEYSSLYACILDNVLSASECLTLLNLAKATTDGEWAHAMINSGPGGSQQLDTESRACGRIIWEDGNIVRAIWARCEASVPELMELRNRPEITGKGWLKRDWEYEVKGLDKRMRFLRYFDGEYFRRESIMVFVRGTVSLTASIAHFDATHTGGNDEEASFITMHLYLNEPDEDSMLEGGATRFHAMDGSKRHLDVEPKTGRVLLFQHEGLLHSGANVTRGVKYSMRTDLMYVKCDRAEG